MSGVTLGSTVRHRRFLIGAALVVSFIFILSTPLFSSFNQYASEQSFESILDSFKPWTHSPTQPSGSAPSEASPLSIPIEEGLDSQPPPIAILPEQSATAEGKNPAGTSRKCYVCHFGSE